MRPVIVIHVIPQYRIAALELLKERFPETHVIVSSGGEWAAGVNAPDVHDRDDVTVLPAVEIRLPGVSLIRMPGLRQRLQELRPDVMLLDPRMGLLSIWPLAVFPLRIHGRPVPTVWWFAGWRNRDRNQAIAELAEWVQRRVIRRGSAAACYSSRARDYAIALGIPPERAVLAQNATDTRDLVAAYDSLVNTEAGTSSDRGLRVLYVGAVQPRKRLDRAIRAISQLDSDADVQLRIVGNGSATGSLRTLAGELGLSSCVDFVHGTYKPSELAAHLRWSDIGILPNQGGLFLNTAMSCGVPVICGRADGTEDDLVVHGETGWLLPDDQPDTIASALRDILASASDLECVARNARQHYEQHATLARMVAGLEEAFLAAVGASRS